MKLTSIFFVASAVLCAVFITAGMKIPALISLVVMYACNPAEL